MILDEYKNEIYTRVGAILAQCDNLSPILVECLWPGMTIYTTIPFSEPPTDRKATRF